MPNLIFATNNEHKVQEIKAALPEGFEILSLKEAGINAEIPEPHDTLEANASEKSGFILQHTGCDCFSEDTGLEVDVLEGAPGVKSARYAGEKASFAENVAKLLVEMKGKSIRTARFRTVISLRWKGQEYFFEGICPGLITEEASGAGGFGYDPVFKPSGSDKTFAEMPMKEKNTYSHRAKALSRLIDFLRENSF